MVPLTVMYDCSSVNNEKDNVSSVMSKVPAQKCFSKYCLDGLLLIKSNCGILFQKKHPIILGQNLLRVVQNEGMKI